MDRVEQQFHCVGEYLNHCHIFSKNRLERKEVSILSLVMLSYAFHKCFFLRILTFAVPVQPIKKTKGVVASKPSKSTNIPLLLT